jgi:hypothetical protein
MTEPQDWPEGEDEAHARPYRPEDFTKLQYVPPTHFQRAVAKLKIVGALTGLLIVVALCGRVAGIV